MDFIRALVHDKDTGIFDMDGGDYDPFIINYFLACNPSTVLIANNTNIYPNMPPEAHFRYLMSRIPRSGGRFNAGSFVRDMKPLKRDGSINNMAAYHRISYGKMKQVMHLISEQEIRRVNSIVQQ